MTQFTPQEAALIVDAMNGIAWTRGVPKRMHLRANVACAITEDNLTTKWEVDGDALVEKLGNLSETQASDVLSKVHTFWNASPHTDTYAALAAHGLCEEAS